MRQTITCLLFCLLVSICSAQSPNQKTYCNPVDINYRYNFEQLDDSISYRSAADPVMLTYKGDYYLFATISNGWWHSKDMLHWQFVTPDKWPMEDICAPAALVVRDTLFLFQSTFDRRPIFYTTTPWNGHLEFYNRMMPKMPGALGPWDPDIFHDDRTDKWYMYFGSSNTYPIYGIELDHNKRLKYIDSAKALIKLHPKEHGWERFGRDHRGTIDPFIEGAWMTEHNGKYYLQYAGPGTEYNVYANGTYVGDNPLGPFTYAPNNPVSYKPGGFMQGAGHGNTFQDLYGNYWNTGTPWVAVNWNFERRISMFPAGFDANGLMYSNTRFGDFPHYLPTKKWQDRNELFTGWMLLSYRKPAYASSVRDTFKAVNVTDENPRTYWVAQANKPGENITVDLLHLCTVNAIQVNFTDYKSNIFASDSTVYIQFKLYTSTDNKTWQKVADLTNEKRDRPNAYIELEQPVNARYVKYEHVYQKAPNLAISDIRIFGNDNGKLPKTPDGLTARRDTDQRNAFISWKPVPGAVGYNILWGIGPGKLYQTYQVFNDYGDKLELRALSVGQDYYIAIEAFNEQGVSKQSQVIHVK
jgi:hypothetical protein